MTVNERFGKIMGFEKVDRLPIMEWATYWNVTVDRWRSEGLPPELTEFTDIQGYFGLDLHKQFWLDPLDTPDDAVGPIKPQVEKWAERQRRGEALVWLTLEGFFWVPRRMLGIQSHLFAFHDEPGLIHEINGSLADFHIKCLREFLEICTPDFITFAEDMSYNNGPMISEKTFDEFLAPYYERVMPLINGRNIPVIIDTDGDITRLIPWFEKIGINGFLPLERQAGTDIVELRKLHPRLRIIGGFDKTVMKRGEAAMRAEFERLLPVIRQGGFIPSVDHQTPPDVSIGDYRVYVGLLKEYCCK